VWKHGVRHQGGVPFSGTIDGQEVRQRGPTVMSGNLEVFDAIHSPWTPIGTIVRTGGKGGKITCEPQRPGATASPPSDPQDRP